MDIKISRTRPFVHFTLADRHTPEWDLQVASARRYHSDHLLNLVLVEPPFRLAMRIDWLSNLLPRLEAGTLVLMVDAMDALFNASMESLVAEFHSLRVELGKDMFGRQASIVFNGEKNCWPHADWAGLHDPDVLATPFPFLNGGMMLGTKEALQTVLRAFLWKEDTYDQTFWMYIYLESRKVPSLPRVEVDNFGRLACCFYKLDPQELEVRNRAVYFRKSGARPAILHFNGPTKALMPRIAGQLGIGSEPLP